MTELVFFIVHTALIILVLIFIFRVRNSKTMLNRISELESELQAEKEKTFEAQRALILARLGQSCQENWAALNQQS